MPDHHRLYVEHTAASAQRWAQTIGSHTIKMVDQVLEQQVEKRALKVIMGIQNLERTYGPALIEQSSEIILSVTSHPTLATFKTIIKRQQSLNQSPSEQIRQQSDHHYGFVRGADYFGGKRK